MAEPLYAASLMVWNLMVDYLPRMFESIRRLPDEILGKRLLLRLTSPTLLRVHHFEPTPNVMQFKCHK